ncbi:MAG: toll/interleukin-1 receptor domain-containing protein [Dehalococcoidia bacterium]
MAHDVFISYSSKDKTVADAVCASLEARKIRCWIAPRDVLPGEVYAEALIESLNESRLMVLVFSANSNDSPQVIREVERAVNKGVPIIPFRIEDIIPSKSMEYFVSSSHWLDAMTPPLEKHLQRLGETVELFLSKGHEALPETEFHPATAAAAQKAAVSKKMLPIYIIGGCILLALVVVGTLFFSGRLGRRINPGSERIPPASTPSAPNQAAGQPNTPDLTKPAAPGVGQAFQDDFSSTSSGWTRVSDDIKDSNYVNGEFSLTVKKFDTKVPIVNRNAGLFKDMTLETDARLVSGPATSLYGLVFREKDLDNYYCFMVSGDGGYILQKRVGGVFTTLVKKNSAAIIKKDAAFNRLGVICKGDQIELLCNGSSLAMAKDNSFTEGWVGLIVNATTPPATAVFDNFKINAN